MASPFLVPGVRRYKIGNRLFRAHNASCADAFRTDRAHGLIYSSYREDDGSLISVEKASHDWGFCAYCGMPKD